MLHTMKLTVKSISYHNYLHEEELVCVCVCGGGGGGGAGVATPSIIIHSQLGGRGVAILRTMFLPPLAGVFITDGNGVAWWR